MSSKEENIKKWELWTVKHGYTPKRHSEDPEEDKLAANISRIYSCIKKEPDKYEELIMRYEQTYKAYNTRNFVCKDAQEVFSKWKKWVEIHRKLPSSRSCNIEERHLACNIYTAITNMNNNKQKYGKIISNYNNICKIMRKLKIIESYQEIFEEWKLWVKEHNKIPRRYSKSEEEAKIAYKIDYLLSKIKSKSQFKQIVEEHKKIQKEFNEKRKATTFLNIFLEWKAFVEKNKLLPSSCSNNADEARIARKMKTALNRYKYVSDECAYIAMVYRQYVKEWKATCKV